jgi:hypothetical protein
MHAALLKHAPDEACGQLYPRACPCVRMT